ncbi:MAG TPA: [FeFe] hydrogenase H-cluster radical SAM maturase HydE, partial [Thermoanaerobaculaceae bacterium]|nr:[FeFe] hydrogenase H-cluster radical SAM maturase HydE [Thermoanaerobaculaceae bacterium]
MNRTELIGWLREMDETRLEELWALADEVRRVHVGDEVHLRGLIEISNHCVQRCTYCGINATNREVERYRMTAAEVLGSARQARDLGYGTVVMQAGEDYGLTRELIADLVRQIKSETGLAVTLSLGERSDEDFLAWREAGADRYLLRFETSDPELYASIHPSLPGRPSDRFEILRHLRRLGYEIGSGVMLGIPGQTWRILADDLQAFVGLDLDMIGVGPYLPHPATPLGRGELPEAPEGEQVPSSELMTYKVVALTRLLCPRSNIPSTTALATLNLAQGRELGLSRGANVVMPN